MAKIPDGPYAPLWREHRRRERLAWWLLLGFLPGVIVLTDLARAVLPLQPRFLTVAAAWMVAVSLAAYRAAALRCPRCGKPFFQRTRSHNSFARKCLHCGLPKWAPANRVTVP